MPPRSVVEPPMRDEVNGYTMPVCSHHGMRFFLLLSNRTATPSQPTATSLPIAHDCPFIQYPFSRAADNIIQVPKERMGVESSPKEPYHQPTHTRPTILPSRT